MFTIGLHRCVPHSRQYVIQHSVGLKQFYVQVRDVFRCRPLRSVMTAGILYTLIAFPTETDVGEVPADTIFKLGLIYGPLVMSIFLGACYAIS